MHIGWKKDNNLEKNMWESLKVTAVENDITQEINFKWFCHMRWGEKTYIIIISMKDVIMSDVETDRRPGGKMDAKDAWRSYEGTRW